MRFSRILSVASLPILLAACSDDSSMVDFNQQGETPTPLPNDSIPPNIPDEELNPIIRDYSTIWKGEGTAENPYQISNETELESIAFYVNDSSMTFKDKFFKQTANIELSKSWTPIGIFGKNAMGLGNRPFSGTYDGDSKVISGMTINDMASYSGLFGLIRGAVVKNVILKNAKMDVGSYAGVLAGKMDSTTVENCVAEDAVIKGADRVGGLVGEASHVYVSVASVSGIVSGENSVGGIVGRIQDGALENLTNLADVSGKSTVGGVVGAFATTVSANAVVAEGEGFARMIMNYGKITGTKDVGGVFATLSLTKLDKIVNYGTVTADSSQMSNVGGVIAVVSNKSVINEIFNAASVSVKRGMSMGGVVGSLKNSTATNIVNLGQVSGTTPNTGGLVGIIDGGESKLADSYNAGVVPNENYSGTIAGKLSSTDDISNVYYDQTIAEGCLVLANHMIDTSKIPKGLTTEEMKAASFVVTLNGTGSVWTSDPTKYNGYPVFNWIK